MSLGKSKFWYSNNCLHFLKRAVPFINVYDKVPYVMEQHALKNVNNCLNSNIYSHLETSVGQSSNPYLNVAHFFNIGVNYTPVAA